MIYSQAGNVKLSKPNYALCNELNCSKEEVDTLTKTVIVADLASILKALEIQYGMVTAMEMWTDVADVVIEIYKEEKENK